MKNKMTRREFMKVCAKSIGVVALGAIFFGKTEAIFAALSGQKKKRFIISVKPFNRRVLYEKHDLAG